MTGGKGRKSCEYLLGSGLGWQLQSDGSKSWKLLHVLSHAGLDRACRREQEKCIHVVDYKWKGGDELVPSGEDMNEHMNEDVTSWMQHRAERGAGRVRGIALKGLW